MKTQPKPAIINRSLKAIVSSAVPLKTPIMLKAIRVLREMNEKPGTILRVREEIEDAVNCVLLAVRGADKSKAACALADLLENFAD